MTDPVLVVGAGPTGLTAAFELARLGVPVRLIDRRDAPATTSRAIGIQARTLELMEQRGLADEIVRLGNPGRWGSIYGGGKRLFHLDFGRVESRYDYMLFLSQAETERILRAALAARGVEPEWRTELIGIAQDALSREAGKVSAQVKHADGSIGAVHAPWLISAEGAHSIVRTTLDLRFEGKTLDEDYALGDLHVDGALADTDFHIFSSEHGFMGLFPMGGGHFRMIASNPDGDPNRGSPPTEAELQHLYDQRSPVPARFHDTTWTSWFRINSRMVPRLRVGRLLLGGDAAHIHSPAGAQGMNTGIQDMVNLCWKLALVEQGEAPATLIDTYEADRLPVMRDVLFKTENLTEVIGMENHLVRVLFDHLAPLVAATGLVQNNSTAAMSQVALGYEDSPLSENHHPPGRLRAGQRAPEIVARCRGSDWSPVRLLTLLDPSGFTLVVAHGSEQDMVDPALASLVSTLRPRTTLIELAPDPENKATYRQQFGERSGAYLIRPDGYVAVAAGAARATDAIGQWMGKWIGGAG